MVKAVLVMNAHVQYSWIWYVRPSQACKTRLCSLFIHIDVCSGPSFWLLIHVSFLRKLRMSVILLLLPDFLPLISCIEAKPWENIFEIRLFALPSSSLSLTLLSFTWITWLLGLTTWTLRDMYRNPLCINHILFIFLHLTSNDLSKHPPCLLERETLTTCPYLLI